MTRRTAPSRAAEAVHGALAYVADLSVGYTAEPNAVGGYDYTRDDGTTIRTFYVDDELNVSRLVGPGLVPDARAILRAVPPEATAALVAALIAEDTP